MNEKAILAILAVVFIFAPAFASEEETKKESKSPETNQEFVYVPRITPEELMGRFYKGEVVMVVDVRSLGEFNARRIIGAKSIPINEIEARIAEFPRDRDIVFY